MFHFNFKMSQLFSSLAILRILVATATHDAPPPLLSIAFDDASASFNISIAGNHWLSSAPLQAFIGGATQRFVQQRASRSTGVDALGAFSCANVSWRSGDGHVLHTSLQTYPTRPDIAIFTQQIPHGATQTNASNPILPSGIRVMDPGNYAPVVAFPSLAGGKLAELGYVTWQSRMVNVEWGTNVTGKSNGTNEPLLTGQGLQGLSTSGPVVLFDTSFSALVVAPMDNFKSAVHHSRANAPLPTWDTGVSSELTSLPQNFRHRTMLVAAKGITAALDTWGGALRTVYGTNRTVIGKQDKNVEYLSYWTDNGAYLSGGAWPRPEGGNGGGTVVNEAAFKAVVKGLREQDLHIKSFQLDDWWYNTSNPQGGVYSACVANWTLQNATFPSGLAKLSRALGTKWILYVPFWCPENEYTKEFRWIHSHQNESNTRLIFSEPHPDDALRFYRMLFDYGIANGMSGFENDYLDYNYLAMPYLRKTHGAANKWLAGINKAALERNLPVQICMALPSDVMATVQFDSMTNYRSSTDYGIDDSSTTMQPHDSNYNIGGSSLLGFALGLRPSKDIFWSHRPENCRADDPTLDPHACGGRWGAHTNPGSNCELNALVATLSTGPLSIADKAGETNATIIRRCVRADGRILQPDKPATSVDSMFAQAFAGSESERYEGAAMARTTPQPLGAEVWTTVVSISGVVWHYVISIDVGVPWHIHGSDFWPMLPNTASEAEATAGWVASSWFTGHRPTPCMNGSRALKSGCVVARIFSAEDLPPFHNTRPIMVANDSHRFDLTELAPVGRNGWVLLGEVGRYVRVSSDRFDEVSFTAGGGGGVAVQMSGSEGETASVTALQPLSSAEEKEEEDWLVQVRSVTFGGSGKATIAFGPL